MVLKHHHGSAPRVRRRQLYSYAKQNDQWNPAISLECGWGSMEFKAWVELREFPPCSEYSLAVCLCRDPQRLRVLVFKRGVNVRVCVLRSWYLVISTSNNQPPLIINPTPGPPQKS